MRRLVALAVLATGLAGCHHGRPAGPAPSAAAVVRGDFDAISVTSSASHQSVAVKTDLRKGVNPLLVARTVDQQGPLSDYGLDNPVASLTYQKAGTPPIVIRVGGTNFDREGVYVQRAGDARVYLVLSSAVRPVLALVGVSIAPPGGG